MNASEHANTFRAAGELYIERYASKNTKSSTWQEARRQLEVDVYPKWGDRPIREITRHDVAELLDGIADRGRPSRPIARSPDSARYSIGLLIARLSLQARSFG
jgi:hypothetical protein